LFQVNFHKQKANVELLGINQHSKGSLLTLALDYKTQTVWKQKNLLATQICAECHNLYIKKAKRTWL